MSFRAVGQDNIYRNVHWFMCLSVPTKASPAWGCQTLRMIPPQFPQLETCHSLFNSLRAQRTSWLYTIFNSKPISILFQHSLPTTVWAKWNKIWRLWRPDRFKGINIRVQKWHRWECPLVLEYKSRLILKQSLQKDLLTTQCYFYLKAEKKRISHFISLPAQWAPSSLTSLFVLDPHLCILVHWFPPGAFICRMS